MFQSLPTTSRRSLEISSEDSSHQSIRRLRLQSRRAGFAPSAASQGNIHNGQAVQPHRLQRHRCGIHRKQVRPRCGPGKFESWPQLDMVLKLLVECEAPTWPHYFCPGCECGCEVIVTATELSPSRRPAEDGVKIGPHIADRR
jgi:hypothetical protein